jgi:hypothetical protein
MGVQQPASTATVHHSHVIQNHGFLEVIMIDEAEINQDMHFKRRSHMHVLTALRVPCNFKRQTYFGCQQGTQSGAKHDNSCSDASHRTDSKCGASRHWSVLRDQHACTNLASHYGRDAEGVHMKPNSLGILFRTQFTCALSLHVSIKFVGSAKIACVLWINRHTWCALQALADLASRFKTEDDWLQFLKLASGGCQPSIRDDFLSGKKALYAKDGQVVHPWNWLVLHDFKLVQTIESSELQLPGPSSTSGHRSGPGTG